MRAVGLNEFGGPEVLEVVELDDPQPGPGEVRVRVTAAAVNPTDTNLRAGAYGEAVSKNDPPWIPGMDLAGTVDATGPDVDRFELGDEVMAAVDPMRPAGGAYASQVVVPAASVVAVPNNVSVEQAATLPMNGLTAWLALDQLGLDRGDTLLVTGGAGLLASFVIPLAKSEALRVVADASPEDRELVESYGADVVLERGDGLAERVREQFPDGVDGVVDTAVLHEDVVAAVRDGGGFASVRGYEGNGERDIDFHKVWVFDVLERTDVLERLADMAGEGRIQLRVEDTYSAERAGEAHERFAEGGVRGRLLITF